MRLILGFLLFFPGTVVLYTQSPVTIDEAVVRQNPVKHTDPIYPPIARAARVTGNVTLQVAIDASGKVIETRIPSGPPMLRIAAMDAVKSWKFKPFEQAGAPTQVSTKVVIPFTLGAIDKNDQQIAAVFLPLSETCNKLVGQGADAQEQVRACMEAAREADKFDANSRFIERRSAYVYCATALIRNKNFEKAVLYGNKAVAVVQQGHDDGSGSSAAYAVRGRAEAFHGNLSGADKDLEVAESFQRTALNTAAGQELRKSYTQTLKWLLGFHAQVLSALGKSAESEAKVQESTRL